MRVSVLLHKGSNASSHPFKFSERPEVTEYHIREDIAYAILFSSEYIGKIIQKVLKFCPEMELKAVFQSEII